ALVLAACSEPEPPAPDIERGVAQEQTAAERRADEAYKDELRARWLELEHAERNQPVQPVEEPEPEPEPLPAPVVVPPAGNAGNAADLPVIAILIDDIGHNLHQGRRLLALSVPV